MTTKADRITALPRLGRYIIDTTRSSVTFRVRHTYGLLAARGTFAIRSGAVEVTEPVGDSTIRAELDTASFHTGNRQRDGHVRSADFLDAEHHPVIAFTSGGLQEATVPGTLTVRGVTRPVSLSIDRYDVTPDRFTVHATARIDRVEFGVGGSGGRVGRHLDIALDITCVPA